EGYLPNPDSDLRATAVKALRFLECAEADNALGAALMDPVSEVRLAAAGALSFRTITPILPTVDQIMKSNADEPLRMALVRSMWARRRLDANVIDLLKWVA